MRTKTEAALEASERDHADDPERAETLARARRFKSSWLELAEALTRVQRSGAWRDWGFDSFEKYARVELHLRNETVLKLTGSYGFLQRSAPAVLERDGVTEPIPSYQAVDFLRRAEEAPRAPRDTLEAVRHRVLDEGVGLPTVQREFKEKVFPIDAASKKQRDAAGLRNVATRLHELLDETDVVPRRLAGDVRAALERLLEAVGSEEAAA